MKNKKAILQALFLAFLVVASIFIIKNRRGYSLASRQLQPGTEVMQSGYLMNTGSIFGTIYHITYESKVDLKPEIEEAMNEVDQSLSMFNPNSTIAGINAGTSNKSDSQLVEVLRLAQQVYKATNGCFDPTVAPLVNAWGFGFKHGTKPDSLQVDSLKALVGLDCITLSADSIIKNDSRMVLDFSAIAKGYGVDRVAHVLEKKGVKNYMVEIGGEVIVKGKNPKGKAWKVGIAKPTTDEDEAAQTKDDKARQTKDDGKDTPAKEQNGGFEEILELEDKAMATSGNYRNYYITDDGRKLAHTIDPHSGYPIQHSILSSTVFAPTCAMADAFATAFMVMGIDEAKKVLKEQPQLEVYFIYTDENGEYKTFSTIKQ